MQDEVKKFLNSAAERNIEVARARKRYAEVRQQAEKADSILSGSPLSEEEREALSVELSEVSRQAQKAVVEAQRQFKAVSDFIDKIPDSNCRMILRLRYLDGQRWVKVRFSLEKAGIYYSERQVARLHGKALNQAREIWSRANRENQIL